MLPLPILTTRHLGSHSASFALTENMFTLFPGSLSCHLKGSHRGQRACSVPQGHTVRVVISRGWKATVPPTHMDLDGSTSHWAHVCILKFSTYNKQKYILGSFLKLMPVFIFGVLKAVIYTASVWGEGLVTCCWETFILKKRLQVSLEFPPLWATWLQERLIQGCRFC